MTLKPSPLAEEVIRLLHGASDDIDAVRRAGGQALAELYVELARARAKFPGNRFLLAALVEEVGELAQAMLQRRSPAAIRSEAIQAACVAIRIAEEGDASFADITDAESLP